MKADIYSKPEVKDGQGGGVVGSAVAAPAIALAVVVYMAVGNITFGANANVGANANMAANANGNANANTNYNG